MKTRALNASGTFTVPLRLGLICLVFLSCSHVDEAQRQRPAAAHASLDTGIELAGDSASPTPLVLSWKVPADDHQSTAITAAVENTTADARSVELRLVGVAPTGQVATRALGNFNVPAKSRVTVSFPTKDLPAQSEGMASTLTLVGFHQVPILPPLGSSLAGSRLAQIQTSTLHVTFEPTGGVATFRNAARQAIVNAKDTRSSFARLRKASVYNHITSEQLDVLSGMRAVGAEPEGITWVSEGRPGGNRRDLLPATPASGSTP